MGGGSLMNDAGKIAFTPKGDYSSTVTYEYLDTVVYNGNAYAALKTTTGNAPEEGSEDWILLARGGTSVPVATEGTEGVVKASDDIGVDLDAKMILRTDFTPQENLTELESGESRNTFFGKIAKVVSELISHINVKASTSATGHVKLSDSSAVTDSTGLALPATEKNASISGTMANQISELNTNLTKTNQTVAGNLTKTNQSIATKQNKLNLISKSQGDITVGAGASRDFTFGISVPADATIVAQIPILVTNAAGISVGRNVNKNFTVRLWNSNSSEKNVGVAYYVIYYV